jgi:hypothetical protein
MRARRPVTGGFFMSNGKELMDTALTTVSLTAWIITMLALVIVLLRKMRGVNIEEIRLV